MAPLGSPRRPSGLTSYGYTNEPLHTPWLAPASSPMMDPHGARDRHRAQTAVGGKGGREEPVEEARVTRDGPYMSCVQANAPCHDPLWLPHHQKRRRADLLDAGVEFRRLICTSPQAIACHRP